MYHDDGTNQEVLEMDNIKSKDAGTYNVTISNEYGSESCPATLMVMNNIEEVQDWKSQLKTTYVTSIKFTVYDFFLTQY